MRLNMKKLFTNSFSSTSLQIPKFIILGEFAREWPREFRTKLFLEILTFGDYIKYNYLLKGNIENLYHLM